MLWLSTLAVFASIVVCDGVAVWLALRGHVVSARMSYLVGFALLALLAFEWLPEGWAFSAVIGAATVSSVVVRPWLSDFAGLRHKPGATPLAS